MPSLMVNTGLRERGKAIKEKEMIKDHGNGPSFALEDL